MTSGFFYAAFSALVAIVGFAIFGKLFKDPLRARFQATVWLAAFVMGWMLLGRMPLPFATGGNGFFWSAILLTLFVWWSPKPVGTRYLVRAILVIAVGLLLLWELHERLGGQVHLRNLLAFFFLGLGLWSIVERSAQQVHPPALILLPLLSLAALTHFLTSRHTGQGILTNVVVLELAMLSGIFLVAFFRPGWISAASVLPFISVFLVANMVCAHFYFNVNPWTMIFLCSPFVLLWIRGWLMFIPRKPRAEVVGLGLLGALPLAYFFWIAF